MGMGRGDGCLVAVGMAGGGAAGEARRFRVIVMLLLRGGGERRGGGRGRYDPPLPPRGVLMR